VNNKSRKYCALPYITVLWIGYVENRMEVLLRKIMWIVGLLKKPRVSSSSFVVEREWYYLVEYVTFDVVMPRQFL
jgi:hypothetical protein